MWEKQKTPPPALENKPSLPGYLIEYYQAFRTLSTRRPRTFDGGLSPIPISEMVSYLEVFGTNDVETFVHVMCMVDSGFLKRCFEKKESSKPAKPAKKA